MCFTVGNKKKKAGNKLNFVIPPFYMVFKSPAACSQVPFQGNYLFNCSLMKASISGR